MIKLIFLLVYNFFRIFLFRLRYGKRCQLGFIQRISPRCRIRLFNKGSLYIGRNCELEAGCDIQAHGNGRLMIGNRVYMNRYCMISAHKYVEIRDGCIFGPGVKIFDNNHRFSRENGVSPDLSIGTIKVGRNCWIASNVILLKGADIGDNCIIGAGCIVSGKIPAGSLVRPSNSYTLENIL